jgi:DNA-binding protein
MMQAEGERTIVLKAMGKAINKTVTIAEILKRKLPLHQITSLSSCEMIDVFEPLEEGLDTVTNHRYVSCMKITLSLEEMDVNNIGCAYKTKLCSSCRVGFCSISLTLSSLARPTSIAF